MKNFSFRKFSFLSFIGYLLVFLTVPLWLTLYIILEAILFAFELSWEVCDVEALKQKEQRRYDTGREEKKAHCAAHGHLTNWCGNVVTIADKLFCFNCGAHTPAHEA